MDGRGDREPLIPVVLCVCCEQSKVLFYPLVLSFGEPVRLWMVSGTEVPLGLNGFY
jgi:hypothetical protein